VRHALVLVVKLLQPRGNDTEALDIWILFRALEQCLYADAYSHERLSSLDVFADRFHIARALQL
jgi:hypothetical protein